MTAPSEQSGNSNLIEVRELTKHYEMGETVVQALRGVSFGITRGCFVAIMGPSGSGKTTLMDILGCLSRPTGGEYILGGVAVSQLAEARLAELRNHEIGFVFQNFNLLSRTTALANVELPLLYDGISRKDRAERAKQALEAVGLGDRVYHKPNELSGGQRQRVAIARALVNKPSIVFADEPTGNLDTTSGESILALFDDLHANGNTIVMVTHERDVAEHAERIMSFRDGKLVKDEWRNNGEWVAKIFAWITVFAVIAAVPAYLLLKEDTIEVTAVTVTKGRVEQTISAISSGTVKPLYQSMVAAGSMGTVMQLHHKEGDHVSKGDVLVELRHAELDAQVQLAEANLKVGSSRLQQSKMGAVMNKEVSGTRVGLAKAQLDQAKKDFERAKSLMDKQGIAQDMFDKASTALKVAQENLAAAVASEGENDVRSEEVRMAESSIEQLNAALEAARSTRDNAFVRAPFDGIVARKLRDEGEAVTIGMPLLQLVDPSQVYVEAPFDEANASQIKEGQKVRINLDAYRGTDFFGTVEWISPVVTMNPDLSRTLDVRVKVEQGADHFLAGMSSDVVILVDEKDSVVFAPTESLIRQEFAYVVENGRAVKRTVKTGVGNWNTVEVLEGIKEGDVLITSVSLAGLKEGVKVKVVDKLES